MDTVKKSRVGPGEIAITFGLLSLLFCWPTFTMFPVGGPFTLLFPIGMGICGIVSAFYSLEWVDNKRGLKEEIALLILTNSSLVATAKKEEENRKTLEGAIIRATILLDNSTRFVPANKKEAGEIRDVLNNAMLAITPTSEKRT